ncbi:MAG: hypothetical protein PHP06_00800 [Clostridia bacterium]|nr:hypothetical protein [Clostridia bacterium]
MEIIVVIAIIVAVLNNIAKQSQKANKTRQTIKSQVSKAQTPYTDIQQDTVKVPSKRVANKATGNKNYDIEQQPKQNYPEKATEQNIAEMDSIKNTKRKVNKQLLAFNKKSILQGIIMKEILGPPKSLKGGRQSRAKEW